MYLALASVVTLAVLTADWLWRRYADRIAPAGSRRWAIPLAAVLLATAALAAVTCRRNMDYVSDERMYRSTLAHAPNNARAILNVAALTSQTGDWPGTLELINRAIAADPTFPISWLQRGIVHREMGQLDQAMQDFNRAIELEREFPAAYNERADMFLRRGDHPAALADCNKAIGQAPQIGLFYHTRAEVYFAMKQYDRAQDDLKLAREHGAQIDQGFLRKLQQAAERKPPALRGAE
jgi:tetratricopeptide (TPR) repeat protein